MSFFSSAVRLIRKKDVKDSQKNEEQIDLQTSSIADEKSVEELNFSLRNYAKESFSVLIVRPLSSCMQKILRAGTFTVTGAVTGGIVAFVLCFIALQFVSVENMVISTLLLNRIEQMLPDSDLAVKSAMLKWNNEEKSFEVNLNKIRFDNFFIPRITILPDYAESFKQQKFVAKSLSIVRPKIMFDISEGIEKLSINPNFAKGGNNKAYFESLSNIENMKDVLFGENSNAVVKLVNADIAVIDHNTRWNMHNFYCEHKIIEKLPKIVDFQTILPNQKYTSGVRIVRNSDSSVYDVKVNSLNPSDVYTLLAKRETVLEKFLPLIQGYNLPVSGDIKISLNKDETLRNCTFNLVAASGTIHIPNQNALSLNLNKRIDNGSLSGTLMNNSIFVDSASVSYGDSGVQLTGLSFPLKDFKLQDTVNINGTLSLTNANMKEMYSILPSNLSIAVVPILENYLPDSKVELLKFDLKGAVSFADKATKEKIAVSQGIFKVHDARIPISDKYLVTNIDAIGSIKTDGLDIKISNALFGKTKINSGIFFISNRDSSWIGKVNVDVPVEDITAYSSEISRKFASLSLDKLIPNGVARLDLKLVKVAGDDLKGKILPFRMVVGEGTISSADNSKHLKVSWNDDSLSIVGDSNKKNKDRSHFVVQEDLKNNSGSGEFDCKGTSEFLANFMPFVPQLFQGTPNIKVKEVWDHKGEDIDLAVDLKNTTITLPVVGSVKSANEQGSFSTHIHRYPDRVVFSKLVLDTPKTKLSGQITTDSQWNITECVINDLVTNGISARLNVLKKDDTKSIVSLVGDSFDAKKLLQFAEQANKNMKLVTYINLKELCLGSMSKIKNVKGTLDILGGRIINGACVGVIGDSTIALNTANIKGGKDYLLSISASNAGDFLKTLNISDTVQGGTINFVIKMPKTTEGPISGAFEMNNFLVKNNPHLTRLISLSSPNYLTGTDLVVGFNTCSGSLVALNGKINIESCRVIGPTIAISMKGGYDRLNDDWKISGLLLHTTSANAPNANGSLATNFSVNGAYWNPNLSVSTPKYVPSEELSEMFGGKIPMLNMEYTEREEPLSPIPSVKDPYAQKAFDRVAAAHSPAKKKKVAAKKVDKKFGVTVRRGFGSANSEEVGD